MQPAPRNLWIPLLIASIIGAGLLGAMFFPPYEVWAGVMITLFGAILLGHPRQLLFLFWLWTSVQGLLMQISSNAATKHIEEAFMAAMIGICAAGYVQRRTDVRGSGGIFKIQTVLLIIFIASWMMNRSPSVKAINFVITYLSFPFVFYVAYTTLDRQHWRYLFRASIGLMLLQVVLNLGWRLNVNPLPNEWKGTSNLADIMQGTFVSCALVSYLIIANTFLLLSALRLDKKYRPLIFLLLSIFIIQWYLTYTNHSYVFFVLLLPIYMLVSKASVRMRLITGIIVIFGAIIFVGLSSVDTFRNAEFGARSQLEDNFNSKNLQRRWERFTQGPKVEVITRITVKNATEKPYLWLLGNGPGNGLSAIGLSAGSPFAWEYLGEFVHDTLIYGGRDMSSASGSFYSGILSIWSELGALGYVLYLGQYIYLILHVGLRLRRTRYTEPVQQVLAEGFVMAALLFLMASFLTDILWTKFFAGSLWIWAAMVWDPVAAEEKTEDGERRTEDGRPVGAYSPEGDQLPARRGLQPGGRSEALNQKNSKTASVANGWQRPPLRK